MVRIKVRKNINPQYPTSTRVIKFICNKCGADYDCYFSSGPICRYCFKMVEAKPEDLLDFPSMRKRWHREGYTGAIT
jgi:hypothetical protein